MATYGPGLVLAFENDGIRRFHIPGTWERRDVPLREEPFWQNSRLVTIEAAGGSKSFSGLATGWINDEATGALASVYGSAAIYAVARGDKVFRFGDDGTPDERITFSPQTRCRMAQPNKALERTGAQPARHGRAAVGAGRSTAGR